MVVFELDELANPEVDKVGLDASLEVKATEVAFTLAWVFVAAVVRELAEDVDTALG